MDTQLQVVLSPGYKNCSDAAKGPMKLGDVGVVTGVMKVGAMDVLLVQYGNQQWKYLVDALRISIPQEMKHHVGTWRNGKPPYCSIPKEKNGPFCLHNQILSKPHWSCCGNENFKSTFCPVAQLIQKQASNLGFETSLSSAGLLHASKNHAKFPNGPALSVSEIVLSNHMKVTCEMFVSGNCSWIIGLVPVDICDTYYLYRNETSVGVKSKGTAGAQHLKAAKIHNIPIVVTVDLAKKTFVVTSNQHTIISISIPKTDVPCRIGICGWRDTEVKSFHISHAEKASDESPCNLSQCAVTFGLSESVLNNIEMIGDGKKEDKMKQAQKYFELGHLRMGFPEALIWPSVVDNISEISEKIRQASERYAQLPAIIKEKKDLIAKLQKELASDEAEFRMLENQSSARQGLLNKREAMESTAVAIKETEEILAARVSNELCKPTMEFSALYETDSVSPKLSLVFNAVGLSSHIIESTAELDSEEFLEYRIHCDLSCEELADLEYCKHMMKQKLVPYGKHQCPVCFCETSQQLIDLLNEHNIVISTEHIKKHRINGPRLLMLTLADIKNIFELNKQDAITMRKNVILYLRKLHSAALKGIE